jgi:dipeptidyl aminopeptidase/acylaminoacyl peptidase
MRQDAGMTAIAPYGAWPSPISAGDVVRAGIRLHQPRVLTGPAGEEVWWTEGRPAEGGRQTVVRRGADGEVSDLLPAPWNARTAVHEYGGVAFLPVPTGGGTALVFTHFGDQRMYRLDPGATDPVPLTPEPDRPQALRYAEPVLSADGTEVWCVRESHGDGGVRRHVVAVPLDASQQVREVVSGSDFLAWPRISPDGRRLAWVAWDHPLMPWDGGELRVGEIGADGTVERWQVLLGGPTESLFQPEWAGDDALYVVSDRSGWWNLHRVPLGGAGRPAPEPLCERAEEFGVPLWQLGYRTYAPLADGRLAVLHGTGRWSLGLLDPATGTLTDLDLPYTVWSADLDAAGSTVVAVAAGPLSPPTLLHVDTATGAATTVREAFTDRPDDAWLPQPVSQALPGPDGREVHVHVYPPTNPEVSAPDGELPPYVVLVHGGPTSQSLPGLDLAKAYFTSRGIGIVDVNYGGSTGYGRAYRERLRGQWGIVDVDDCVAAARALVDRGQADGARLVIKGGSAGGWTTLAALTRTDAFAAGVSYYGVAELLEFVADTHDFESRYVDGLVGPLPQCRDRYVERAPLSHVDSVSCPVLLLQGAEDKVVPPSQSEMFRDALARKGIPHAYLLFDGEQHGFRRADTQIACLQAELSFYGQVFGFDPPGVPRLRLSTGAD